MNIISLKLLSIFDEFQKIPKGVLIDMPNELIQTGLVITRIITGERFEVYFTRRTLKHLAEKADVGKMLLYLIPITIARPDMLLKGLGTRQILSRRIISDKPGRFHVIVVEKQENAVILVTSFFTDEKYLKNFEILWRTGASQV